MRLKRSLSSHVFPSFVTAAVLLGAALSASALAQNPIPGFDPLAFSDHRGESFEGFDFHGRDLSYGKYQGANFRGASFAGAEIDNLELQRADLRETTGWAEAKSFYLHADEANFDDADLSGTTTGGYFERARFRGADLTNATLSGRFHGANFDGAKVTGAVFLGAGGTEALHNDLRTRGAIVDGADLAAAAAAGRSFRRAMLSGANLADVDLAGAELAEAGLHSARLVGADLSEANLQNALLAWAEAEGTNFSGATLSEASCAGLDAQGADFRDAKLIATELCGTDLRGAEFANADLTNADLRGADLTDANLEEAQLDGVQIDDAILDGVKGLPEEELAAMRSRAGRWRHDFERGWYGFLRTASLPLHLALSALALGLTVFGAALGRMKLSFGLLAAVNAIALVPFALFVLFSLAGGSPVAQMSSYELWRMWLHGWPALLLCVGAAGVFGSGLGLWEVIARSIAGPRHLLPLSIAMAVATSLNCFFAFQVLFLIAPDA